MLPIAVRFTKVANKTAKSGLLWNGKILVFYAEKEETTLPALAFVNQKLKINQVTKRARCRCDNCEHRFLIFDFAPRKPPVPPGVGSHSAATQLRKVSLRQPPVAPKFTKTADGYGDGDSDDCPIPSSRRTPSGGLLAQDQRTSRCHAAAQLIAVALIKAHSKLPNNRPTDKQRD